MQAIAINIPNCNAKNSLFNASKKKCELCPSGTVVNINTQTCDDLISQEQCDNSKTPKKIFDVMNKKCIIATNDSDCKLGGFVFNKKSEYCECKEGDIYNEGIKYCIPPLSPNDPCRRIPKNNNFTLPKYYDPTTNTCKCSIGVAPDRSESYDQLYDPAKGTCVRDSKYKNTLIGLNTCSGPGNFAKDGKCIKYNQDTQYVMKSRLVNLPDGTQRIEGDQIITCPKGSKIKYKPTDTLTMFLKADPGIPGSTDRYQTSPIGNTFCEAPAGKHYNISKNTFETCPKDTIDMEDFNNTDDDNKKKMKTYLKYVNNQACVVNPKLKETKAISYDTDENKVIDNNIPNFKCPTNSKVDTYVSNTCICNDVNGDKYYWIPPEANKTPPTTSTPGASQSTTSTTTPEPYSPLIKNSDGTYGSCVDYKTLDNKLKKQKMQNFYAQNQNPSLSPTCWMTKEQLKAYNGNDPSQPDMKGKFPKEWYENNGHGVPDSAVLNCFGNSPSDYDPNGDIGLSFYTLFGPGGIDEAQKVRGAISPISSITGKPITYGDYRKHTFLNPTFKYPDDLKLQCQSGWSRVSNIAGNGPSCYPSTRLNPDIDLGTSQKKGGAPYKTINSMDVEGKICDPNKKYGFGTDKVEGGNPDGCGTNRWFNYYAKDEIGYFLGCREYNIGDINAKVNLCGRLKGKKEGNNFDYNSPDIKDYEVAQNVGEAKFNKYTVYDGTWCRNHLDCYNMFGDGLLCWNNQCRAKGSSMYDDKYTKTYDMARRKIGGYTPALYSSFLDGYDPFEPSGFSPDISYVKI